MTRRARETLAALVFLAVFLGAGWLALDFGPRARMIPLPLAIFGALLALVQLALQRRGAGQDLKMDLIHVERPVAAEAGAAPTAPSAAGSGAREGLRTQAKAFAIVGGLLAMTLVLGPVAAVFLFTAGYFLKTRYYAPPLALAYAAAFTLTVYLLFFVALQIQPYYGVLAPLIARFD